MLATVVTSAEEHIGENRRRHLEQDSAVETRPPIAAFAGLYEQHYDKIVRYIFVRVGNQREAEDLGGDVFVKALESFDSYRGSKEQMPGWLFKIAHNLVVDHVRKVSKQRNIPLEDVDPPDPNNLEEMVERKSEIERLRKALDQLTPAQREVIGLRFFAGLPSDEVGKILGKKSGAVREMQRAAMEVLRREMCGVYTNQ